MTEYKPLFYYRYCSLFKMAKKKWTNKNVCFERLLTCTFSYTYTLSRQCLVFTKLLFQNTVPVFLFDNMSCKFLFHCHMCIPFRISTVCHMKTWLVIRQNNKGDWPTQTCLWRFNMRKLLCTDAVTNQLCTEELLPDHETHLWLERIKSRDQNLQFIISFICIFLFLIKTQLFGN